jgi:effector-binding domain-containing protein
MISMDVKIFNPIRVLSFTKQVTLSGLSEFVRIKARELYKDALYNHLEVMGPVYWVYYGMDGNPQTLFTLEIALPVAVANGYKGDFQVKTLGTFKCISSWHKGSWGKLPDTYGNIFHEISANQLNPSGECREIYQHIDFDQDENNLTEVQVGIH